LSAIGLFVAALPRPSRLIDRVRLSRATASSDVRAALLIVVDPRAAALASGVSLPLAFAEIAPTLRPELGLATKRVAASLALGSRVPDALGHYAAIAHPA